MRFPFRAILFGLVAGAALFFFPFGFPFLAFFFFLFILSRLFFGWRRWGYGRGWGHPYRGYYHNDIIPIDGYNNYPPRSAGKDEHKISID